MFMLIFDQFSGFFSLRFTRFSLLKQKTMTNFTNSIDQLFNLQIQAGKKNKDKTNEKQTGNHLTFVECKL